jgi:hypothetical protein
MGNGTTTTTTMFYKTYYGAGNKLAVEGSFGGQKAIINTICWDGDDVV